MSVKCTQEKENVCFHSQTNFNLHYKAKGYSGQESVHYSKTMYIIDIKGGGGQFFVAYPAGFSSCAILFFKPKIRGGGGGREGARPPGPFPRSAIDLP